MLTSRPYVYSLPVCERTREYLHYNTVAVARIADALFYARRDQSRRYFVS